MWREILKSKCGNWRNIKKDNNSKYDSLWRKDLGKVCKTEEQQNLFDANVIWKVNLGSTINFWRNRWLGKLRST